MADNERVLKLVDSWYIETRTGYDGPFDSYEEAQVYIRLSQAADAARFGVAENSSISS